MKNYWNNLSSKQKLLAAAAVFAVLAGGWRLYANITHQPQAADYVPLVRTITVGCSQVNTQQVYPGEVKGRYESQLAFQVGGKIVSRLVNIGDKVTAGQVLMTLDPKDVQQNLAASEAQLASAQANYKLAADNAARYNSLYASGAVSEAIRDQYNAQLETAAAALRQAKASAVISGNQMEYTRLTSDADGVVAAINGEVGQIAAAGSPMVTVVRDGQREVQINVPENVPLHIGQAAIITFWALPNVETAGSVREISPMADAVTRTYKAAITVPNLPPEAKLGMTAKAVFANDNNKEEIILPVAALYNVNGQQQVWLVRDNHVQLQPVQIAGYEGNNVRLTSGVSTGDVIVTAGLSKLTPNQEVRTTEGGEQ